MNPTSADAPGQPDQFPAGVQAGLFPRPTAEVSGISQTTGNSPWLGVRCTRCRHTFRRGDQVWVAADGRALHIDPALDCGGTADIPAKEANAVPRPRPDGPDPVLAFTTGLLDAWPPVNGAPVVVLAAGDWPVTRRTSGPSSPTCPVCGHTFRVGDAVILCPCADLPDDPRRAFCQLPVHRDPAAGLTCWDDWCPDGRLVRCPRTHEKLPG